MTQETELVYGLSTHAGDTLIVLPTDVARDIAADYDALRAAITYGQARALQLTHVDVPGLDEEGDADEDANRADVEPYDPYESAAASNGDWPVSAATLALDHLPEDLDIGEEVGSPVRTPGLFIDPGSEAVLIEAAHEAGYTLRRDDQLIARLDY